MIVAVTMLVVAAFVRGFRYRATTCFRGAGAATPSQHSRDKYHGDQQVADDSTHRFSTLTSLSLGTSDKQSTKLAEKAEKAAARTRPRQAAKPSRASSNANKPQPCDSNEMKYLLAICCLFIAATVRTESPHWQHMSGNLYRGENYYWTVEWLDGKWHYTKGAPIDKSSLPTKSPLSSTVSNPRGPRPPLPFPQARLIDGGEFYLLRSADDFLNGTAEAKGFEGLDCAGYNYRKFKITSGDVNAPFISNSLRPVWPDLNSIGFGVWADEFITGSSKAAGIKGFTNTLRNALRQADDFVWVYTEKGITYLLPDGEHDPYYGTPGATDAWVEAIGIAKKSAPTKKVFLYGNYLYSPLQPSPQYIANNAALLKTLPFDGLSVMIKDLNDDGKGSSSIDYRLLSSEPISYDAIARKLAPLRGLDLGSLKYNLATVQMVALGGDPPHGLTKVDFYDDKGWAIVTQNATNLAKAIKEVGLAGIFIDDEDYSLKFSGGSDWMGYAASLYSHMYTIEQYRDKARLRGRQLMTAILGELPNAIVVFAHSPAVCSIPENPYYDRPGTPGIHQELGGPFFAGCMEVLAGLSDNRLPISTLPSAQAAKTKN